MDVTMNASIESINLTFGYVGVAHLAATDGRLQR